jgi:hypothetical protein
VAPKRINSWTREGKLRRMLLTEKTWVANAQIARSWPSHGYNRLAS